MNYPSILMNPKNMTRSDMNYSTIKFSHLSRPQTATPDKVSRPLSKAAQRINHKIASDPNYEGIYCILLFLNSKILIFIPKMKK